MHAKLITWVIAVAMLLLATSESATAAEKAKNDNVIKDGMVVSLDYTLKGSDGKVIDTNKGRPPLQYVHGQRMIVPGLEKELTGMKVGGEKNVTVKPEDAYGPVNPQALQEFPKEKIPAEKLKEIKVGTMIPLRSPDGQSIAFPVTEIKEKSIVINVNHPMAGKTLVFNVKIVDIQPAPPPPVPGANSAAPTKPAEPAKAATPAQPAKPAEPAKK